uniref:Uncharacterized protein n=1 Tax=Oryza punctata TaxID=4537 RepID=A0A0E0M3G8_ORYPU
MANDNMVGTPAIHDVTPYLPLNWSRKLTDSRNRTRSLTREHSIKTVQDNRGCSCKRITVDKAAQS